jgi:hypothetical protein
VLAEALGATALERDETDVPSLEVGRDRRSIGPLAGWPTRVFNACAGRSGPRLGGGCCDGTSMEKSHAVPETIARLPANRLARVHGRLSRQKARVFP